MFRKAALKLAGLYLLILLTINLMFSLSVYQISIQEFERSLRKPPIPGLERVKGRLADNVLNELMNNRENQYQAAKERVVTRLAVINFLILIIGGLLSYYLALRTLRPIEKAHEAQSRFTADASHELRTPLAAMQAETEVALMNPKLHLTQAREVLESNLEEIVKLAALSESLLNLARRGLGSVNLEPVAVKTIIDSAVSVISPLASKKIITIISEGDLAAKILADQVSLTEAFVTLLDNAIKYSPEKSSVTISATSEKDNVLIIFQDQGKGIAPKDLSLIFDRFYRADNSRSKQASNGYGIGLAIAKSIVESHGGAITVHSAVGSGATFTVQLPKA